MEISEAGFDRKHNPNPFTRHGLMGMTAITVAAWVACPAGKSLAEDVPVNPPSDPVLNLMLEKGMITEAEAAKVQSQADAMRTNPVAQFPPSKWIISSGIKNIGLFGDFRLRYEDRQEMDPAGGHIDLQRMRYAVRLGLRGEAFDDFYYGFRMETASNPRSAWVTFGNSSGTTTPYSGPFGKSTGGLDVGQIYLGWRPTDWFDLTAGKMPNPLYTTPMVWSSAISPEGLSECFKYTVGEADLFVNFAQFLYEDTNPNETTSGYFLNLGYTHADTPFILAWQGGVDYHLTKKVDFKIAPILYDYMGGPENQASTTGIAIPDFGGPFIGQGAVNNFSGYNIGNYDGYYANQTGINDLMVLEIPFELNVKMDHYDAKLFGDYAQNLDGSSRAQAAYLGARSLNAAYNGIVNISQIPSAQTRDDVAYQIGLAVGSKDAIGLVNGSTAKKHGWEARAYWQHVEQYALDPNLVDQDFFAGALNMEGVFAAFAYGFSDNFIGTFRYGHASRINSKLGTGGSGQDIPQMNAIGDFDLFQFDLTFKF